MESTRQVKLYPVIAFRYGRRDGYNFPIGVFLSLEDAKSAAKYHHIHRGGKYDHEIYEIDSGEIYGAGEAAVAIELEAPELTG